MSSKNCSNVSERDGVLLRILLETIYMIMWKRIWLHLACVLNFLVRWNAEVMGDFGKGNFQTM